ncbi:hypothetical protein CVD28_09280 [Bacillus sp. M6-12]|uniref:motility associated factor glycosyltransferase family protein n=1 Tax=Bacillus sp. M6-12 TaxID=2054166 RepID=UPI000C7866A2|nr:6-hydroxymethylpterin diphosphokinase MptE-like protein [Bacillus sp. M6-12]PLS17875.1 hypothetical protein CVD28_09280 [Bacillus sp. M6-12]
MLIENINFLKRNYPETLNFINVYKEQLKSVPYNIQKSKVGYPTIQVQNNHRNLFIHSKYDPVKEASLLIDKYKTELEEGKYSHVLFYGVGFGYHIEQYTKMYPSLAFSIYEPNPAIFYHYICSRNLVGSNSKKLENVYVEVDSSSLQPYMNHFASQISGKVLLIMLPSYEQAFPEQCNNFRVVFKDKVQSKLLSLGADINFSRRWTLNSLMNLPTTLSTPNIIRDKMHFFKGKPVIIVSAGPSLHDEYENLKFIKEMGLAYIFAVGSANKALIANNILPDAVCTYDPQDHNFTVFAEMVDKGITSVPMIYGTSVGYETLKYYPGPKLHVVTSQDTVTSFYDGNNINSSEVVDDAFSIAIITLQILAKMEVASIILVGQNFAFRDNLFYSKDIIRDKELGAAIQESDLQNVMTVKSVDGNVITTNSSFNQMRLLMEYYISIYSEVNVINTTKGGAHIDGTAFVRLEEIIQTCLRESVVDKEWYINNNEPITEHLKGKIDKMNFSMLSFVKTHNDIFSLFTELGKWIDRNNKDKIISILQKFDRLFHKFSNNDFYSVFIKPSSRVNYEILHRYVKIIKEEEDITVKSKRVIQEFGAYLGICRTVYNDIAPIIKSTLNTTLEREFRLSSWENYGEDSGVFQYSQEWRRREIKIHKKKGIKPDTICTYYEINKQDAKIQFKFKGTGIRILGGKQKKCSNQLRISIDGKTQKISAKDNQVSVDFTIDYQNVLYERENLKNSIHEVVIEVLNDDLFIFQGVQIKKGDRIFHIDEVMNVEELEVGKRIRCHYKADYNKAGFFSNLGEKTKEFIQVQSAAEPDGDFYFIMVDYEKGYKKLAADRNIQHSISWEELNNNGFIFGKEMSFKKHKGIIRSLTGGYAFRNGDGGISLFDKGLGAYPTENEWDTYIISSNLNGHIKAGDKLVWNWDVSPQTWCQESPMIGLIHPFNPNAYDDKQLNRYKGISRWKEHSGKGLTFNYTDHIHSVRGFRPVLYI